MLNQSILVGRLTQDLKEEFMDNDRKAFYITIAIPRNYKNDNGEYDTDFLPVVLSDNIRKNVCEYCKKGDILGIKGRTESIKDDDSYRIRIVADKVTFLSSNRDLVNQN